MNQIQLPKKTGAVEGITHSLIAARTEYAAHLKISGISYASILKTINEMAPSKGWGTIEMRQLRRGISRYFSHHGQTLSQEEREQFLGLREAHLATMQNAIEQTAIHIRTKQDWKPFEKIKALSAYFHMLYKYAKIEGYEKASMRKTSIGQNRERNKAIIETGSSEMLETTGETKSVLTDYIKALIEEKSNEVDSMVETESVAMPSSEEIRHSETEEVLRCAKPEFVYTAVPILPFDCDFKS